MKVAVAFFGLPRNSAICYPSIVEKIYGSINNFNVRSFYHFYDKEEVVNERSGESDVLLKTNYSCFEFMEGIIESPDLCLESWGFERLKSFGDTWNDNYASIGNLIHQLNSLYKVTNLIEVSLFDPDVVIFVRPDLIYHDILPMYSLIGASKEPKTVYIPGWQWWNGLNDRFAICGKESYFSYGKRISVAENFCLENKRSLHSERLLKYALVKSGAKIKFLNCTASRVRVSGLIVEESFSDSSGMGKQENRFTLPVSKIRAWADRVCYKKRRCEF